MTKRFVILIKPFKPTEQDKTKLYIIWRKITSRHRSILKKIKL